MQHANARFDRIQPREWRDIPFAMDDAESLPALPASLKWIALWAAVLFLLRLFLEM